ncbi:MAG: sulfatase [Planctomycetota bacterium]
MLLSILAASLSLAPPQSGDAPPPNVLWLTVEDMSPWIGPYGDTTVPTPHLDAFAREAIRYDNAFSGSPVCAPARTALITGMRPTRIGAMHMRTRSRSKAAGDDAYGDLPLYEAVPPPFVRCFPETLRRAGYHVTNNSKTDYQFVAPAWTWDASSRKAHYRDRPEGAPFFAVFNHTGTHESQAFPTARKRPSAVALEDVPIPPFYPDTPAVRDAMKRTYDNIAAMDAWFGKKLAELEESGLADSTIVFFYSDHGVGLPRGKRSVYGTGTRVPLLVRIPEAYRRAAAAPSSPTDRLVSFIDFGPTVLSLAGIAPDERLDGRAFLGPHAAAPRQHVFLHADRFDAARDRTRAITDGRRLVVHNLMPEVPHLIANAYRERIPMTHDLYALRDGGARSDARTPAQWQVASIRRPRVEWYDAANDPWEVVDLVHADMEAPAREAFERLDRALESDHGSADVDLGLLDDEAAMVRERLWGSDEGQPTTANPECSVELDLGTGRTTLHVTCATEGASIGLRDGPDAPWRVYDPARLEVPGDAEVLEVRAHRIGHLPSEVVRVPLR